MNIHRPAWFADIGASITVDTACWLARCVLSAGADRAGSTHRDPEPPCPL